MIVVGVDGSAESLRALRWAIEEGRLRGTGVKAIYAWRYPYTVETNDPYLISQGFTPIPIDPGEPLRSAEVRLADAVARVATDTDRVEQAAIEGHPADVLVRAATPSDVLVVGSRGRGGFVGLLLGSVSQACAHHARCPVVIVPHPAEEQPAG